MTPQEYISIAEGINAAIEVLKMTLLFAREQANKSPMPVNVRPATATDITPGAVIWYKGGENGPNWSIVAEIRWPGDSFKAYLADDGCRYGLYDAYIEVEAVA